MSRARRQSTHSSSRTLTGCFDQPVLRLLQESDDLPPGHRRESFEKIIDRFARLKVIEQRLHRDSRPVEHGGPTHYVGAAGDDWLFHGDRLPANRPHAQRWRLRSQAPVGWVERSETHHLSAKRTRWIPRCPPHPYLSTCWELATIQSKASVSVAKPSIRRSWPV